MSQSTVKVNNRQLTVLNPHPAELVFDIEKNYLFDLSYLGVLQVTGERAQEFLQGQLSCNLLDVNPNQMRQGALCDLKGRILSLLDVVNWHGFQLILPQDLLRLTETSLAKTALFSRAALNPSNDYTCLGFHLQDTDDLIPYNANLTNTPYEVIQEDNYCCYCLGNNHYIFLVKSNESQSICDPFINKNQWRGSLAWHALQLQQKRVDIYPESRGLFLPHRLDLQLSGYLSFNKGCYKGQEIIARMHYRAKLKHQLKILMIESKEPLKSGQKIVDKTTHDELGELIDYCPIGNNQFLIAASILFDHTENFSII